MTEFDIIYPIIASIITGTIIPFVKKFINDLRDCVDQHDGRIELLEFIAIRQHPELVDEFKKLKEVKSIAD